MIRDKTILELKSKESWGELHKRFNKLPPGEYEIYIADKKPTRSARQRKYYYAVLCYLLSEHTGFTKDEMNEALKEKFNPKEFPCIDGPPKIKGASIEAESPARCEEIFEAIRRFFAENMDFQLPLPNEVPDELMITVDSLHKQYE